MGRSKRGQFFTPLDLRNAGNGRHFILIAPLQYLDDRPDGIPIHITVPMGFVTDLASIPRGLWNLFPPHGRYDYAAVVHDYLYRTDAMAGADIPMVSQARRGSHDAARGEWDWVFYEKEHGKDATHEFHEVVDQLEGFVNKKKWNLPYNLNKYYTGFKLGNKVVFDVSWEGTKTWKVRMKIPHEIAQSFTGEIWEYQRYDAPFKNAIFRLKPGKSIDVSELSGLLVSAYKNVSGNQE